MILETDKTENLKSRHWWRSGKFIFAFFTFLAIINLPDVFFYYREDTTPTSLLTALGRLLLANYLWVVFVPLIFRLGDVFPISHPKLVNNLLIHLFLGFAVGVLYTIGFHLILGLLESQSLIEIADDMFQSVTGFFHNVKNGFIYYVWIQTFNQAADYSHKLQEREFRLQQAELKALKSQLNPHFLFNTLNAISALVYSSPKDADQTIVKLSELLRISFEEGKTEEIPLEEELNFLRAYLQIHQTLMNKRLEVEWKISPDTLKAAVPNMILQPLVENSIQHGLAPLKKGGRIEISSYRNNGALYLEVRDNGRGLGKREDLKTGIGIANTQTRLQFLYADQQEFLLKDGDAVAEEGSGVKVCIKIPFRLQVQKEKKDEN